MDDKQHMRARLREVRRAHVAALPPASSHLLFLRPPGPVAAALPEAATVGLYVASAHEAPTQGYARWLYENGFKLALPWFAGRSAAMEFRAWHDPYDNDALIPGPFGQRQPNADAPTAQPSVVFVPLIGFTATLERLGHGGGHYDRWLAAHPQVTAIGLAWDCQLVDALPLEPHDRPLAAVITPTRLYGELGSMRREPA